MSTTREQLTQHLDEDHGYDVHGTKDTHGDDMYLSNPNTPIQQLVDVHDDDHTEYGGGPGKPHTHNVPMGSSGNELRISFEPIAIREHFDGEDTGLYLEQISNASLANAARDLLSQDGIWEWFHNRCHDLVGQAERDLAPTIEVSQPKSLDDHLCDEHGYVRDSLTSTLTKTGMSLSEAHNQDHATGNHIRKQHTHS